jgi:hypothetical protein
MLLMMWMLLMIWIRTSFIGGLQVTGGVHVTDDLDHSVFVRDAHAWCACVVCVSRHGPFEDCMLLMWIRMWSRGGLHVTDDVDQDMVDCRTACY